MLERFTVDALADTLHEHLGDARMQARVTRRFLRAGRRDGRRRRTCRPMTEYVTAAVDVASSRILETHLDREAPVLATIAELRHAAAPPAAGGQAQPATAETTPQAPAGGDRGHPALAVAISRVEERRLAAGRRRQAELQAAQQEERRQAAVRLAVAEEQRAHLRDAAAQRLATCREAGQLLWSRYRAGYARGAAKHDDAGELIARLPVELTFALPEVDLVRRSDRHDDDHREDR